MRKAKVHKRHKAFDFAAYYEGRKKAWQRRMAGFEGLLMKAAKGDPEPLIDYFERSGPFQLSEQDGLSLAWLLRKKLPAAAHRPRGSFTPTNRALRRASYLLRYGKRVWCKKHGRHRVSKKAPIASLAKRALELVEQEFPSVRGKISVDAVRDFKRSIREDEVGEPFDDFLPEAMWEIKKVVLK